MILIINFVLWKERMKIFHLNCGMLNPPGGKLVNQSPAKAVCHCLLIDNDCELILIDSGVGLEDIANPKRLGIMHYFLGLSQNFNDTAALQVTKLGYKREDVKHIILTHMDLDHTGGLPDFPNAYVHVYQPEFSSAMNPKSIKEKIRYRKSHFSHSPKWVVHNTISKGAWFGLDCIKSSNNLPYCIFLIPLVGHTKGHCCVAIKNYENWIIHAGDTYYNDRQIDPKPGCTPGFILFQYFAHSNHRKAFKHYQILRDVVNQNRDKINVFCSHDPAEFDQYSLLK